MPVRLKTIFKVSIIPVAVCADVIVCSTALFSSLRTIMNLWWYRHWWILIHLRQSFAALSTQQSCLANSHAEVAGRNGKRRLKC
ncbi:hypothetical protein JOM56_011658 [Amanita muscaria]